MGFNSGFKGLMLALNRSLIKMDETDILKVLASSVSLWI